LSSDQLASFSTEQKDFGIGLFKPVKKTFESVSQVYSTPKHLTKESRKSQSFIKNLLDTTETRQESHDSTFSVTVSRSNYQQKYRMPIFSEKEDPNRSFFPTAENF
jgi:hypothetical protein